MEKEEFYQLAKNRNNYRILKPLDGTLNYAPVGDNYFSDTLYDLGYNIPQLVADGYLQLVPRIFEWEKLLVGKNKHTVLSVCSECGSHGVNMPLDRTCGNCGYTETRTYYDASTVNYLVEEILKQPKASLEGVEEKFLRHLIDITWNVAFEDESVPSTSLQNIILKKAGYGKD